MLDAGYAKPKDCDPHIKHIHCFESRAICKLLNSPHYIGRGCIKIKDHDKYIKNKQICKLIDELRYKDGEEKLRESRKHSAKLHYKGIVQPYLNGGGASAIYDFGEKLDLGDAGSPEGVIFIPHVEK